MAWDYNYRDIPCLLTYEQAVAHWLRAVPYKSGKFKGEKPLGKRSRNTVRIRKQDNGDIEIFSTGWNNAYVATAYATYKPDGAIVVSSKTKWAFDRGILSALLGHEVNHINGAPHIYCCDPTGVAGRYPLKPGYDIVFRYERDKLIMTNPPGITVLRLHRQNWNLTRAKYAKFIRYLRGAFRLRGDRQWPKEEYAKRWGVVETGWRAGEPNGPPSIFGSYQGVLKLCRSDDPADNYTAVLWLSGYPYGSPTTESQALETFYDMIRAEHADVCFVEATVKPGVPVNDHYRRALKRFGVEFKGA